MAPLGGVDDPIEEQAGDADDDAGEQEPGDHGRAHPAQDLEGAVEPVVAGVRGPADGGLDAHEQRRQGREREQDAQPEHCPHPGVAEHSEGTPRSCSIRPVPRRSGAAGSVERCQGAAIVAPAAMAKRSRNMHLADTAADRHDVLGIGNAIVDVLAYAEDALVAGAGARARRHDADRRGAQRASSIAGSARHARSPAAPAPTPSPAWPRWAAVPPISAGCATTSWAACSATTSAPPA